MYWGALCSPENTVDADMYDKFNWNGILLENQNAKKWEQFPFSKLMGSQWLWCQTCVSSSCSCCQTYSQLAHPIQQARALGLLFQSKVLDIDNIDVSFVLLLFFLPSNQPSQLCLFTPVFCLWLYIFLCFTLWFFWTTFFKLHWHLLLIWTFGNQVSAESLSASC